MNLKKLIAYLKKNDLKINYVDVGARDDLSPLFKKLEEQLNVAGFEVNYEEFLNLKQKFPNRKYYNFGLWSEKQDLDLYITKEPGSSSLYRPNIKQNSEFKDRFHSARDLVDKKSMKCRPLDSIDDLQIDFLKIDTQGAEYEILKGAEKTLLCNMPLVTCETWTTEVYEKAPLMHKVIELMYDYGYELLDMSLCHSAKHKNTYKSISKAIAGGYEILFYKKRIDWKINKNTIIKNILLLDFFGYKDLAFHIFTTSKIQNKGLKNYLVKNLSPWNNKKVIAKKTLNILYNKLIGSTYPQMFD